MSREDHGWFCPDCGRFYPYLQPEDVACSGGMYSCFPEEVTRRMWKRECCVQAFSEHQFPFARRIIMHPTGEPYHPSDTSASNPSDCSLAYQTSGGLCSVCGRNWEDCNG